MSCVHEPRSNLRIKPLDVEIQVLRAEFEDMAAKHTLSTK
jgi:hypothetical protein